MGRASIPVDLLNPGQVFACLGFLEVADLLLGNAEGGFNWTDQAHPRFEMQVNGEVNPFRAVCEFLCTAQLRCLAPRDFAGRPATGEKKNVSERSATNGMNNSKGHVPMCTVETFPAPKVDDKVLPIRLERGDCHLDVTQWCDGSSRNQFKLFAGQQSSTMIARQMIAALRKLWDKRHEELASDPYNVCVPLRGSSFKFDAQKAWTAIDAGYSPDEQKHFVQASPAVEILAPMGLEHARPDQLHTCDVRYGVWKGLLPPMLARPSLAGIDVGMPLRVFRFSLKLAGKNKLVTFAREEPNR